MIIESGICENQLQIKFMLWLEIFYLSRRQYFASLILNPLLSIVPVASGASLKKFTKYGSMLT